MKLNILCIDDSKAVHAYLKECVQDVSASFTSKFDGKAGFLFLKTEESKICDLIFLDWEMPEMTGPEVMTEIKALGIKTPVIMLTSKNEVENITKMLALGAAEYIMKPFTKEIILEKIAYTQSLMK